MDYFNELCTTKIDHFGQLFSIYKDQIIEANGKTFNSSYYNLNTEIKLYLEQKEECKQELNGIRIYHNNNAAYISASLLTNYELYSYICMGRDTSLNYPLLFKLGKKSDVATSEENFEFYDTIERVYNDAEKSVESMISFYCNHLIDSYPPDKFIDSSLFSVRNPDQNSKGDFQFRLIISRHITYLESFRQISLNHSSKLINLNYREKVILNLYLVRIIVKYCKLYCDNFTKIKDLVPVDDFNPLNNSYKVYNRFLKYGNNIINNENDNFDPIE
ncbi:hypothetical protein [Plebeiibacterium sediminum]|uniref:Uncharacterized protein n=1 Tax=Plebeiibacterium sediminum TaxID=2992112 RepID=A0AAE3MAP5_9BACT|nr:hypothetical protein [Plebeiobacterium sediminum]MCW3789550.1 hypothetical protein [Plebeiobacterium sediminum]